MNEERKKCFPYLEFRAIQSRFSEFSPRRRTLIDMLNAAAYATQRIQCTLLVYICQFVLIKKVLHFDHGFSSGKTSKQMLSINILRVIGLKD